MLSLTLHMQECFQVPDPSPSSKSRSWSQIQSHIVDHNMSDRYWGQNMVQPITEGKCIYQILHVVMERHIQS